MKSFVPVTGCLPPYATELESQMSISFLQMKQKLHSHDLNEHVSVHLRCVYVCTHILVELAYCWFYSIAGSIAAQYANEIERHNIMYTNLFYSI